MFLLLIEIIVIISIGIILLSWHKRASDLIKFYVDGISVIKDIIKGEWILSPYSLKVGGKYDDREIQFEYVYGWEGSPSYVCLGTKARINLKEIPSSDQKVLSNYFGAHEDNYLVSYMIPPSANFFNSENIKNLLDDFLIVVESIENKNINNAINAWKIISEKNFLQYIKYKCFARKQGGEPWLKKSKKSRR